MKHLELSALLTALLENSAATLGDGMFVRITPEDGVIYVADADEFPTPGLPNGVDLRCLWARDGNIAGIVTTGELNYGIVDALLRTSVPEEYANTPFKPWNFAADFDGVAFVYTLAGSYKVDLSDLRNISLVFDGNYNPVFLGFTKERALDRRIPSELPK